MKIEICPKGVGKGFQTLPLIHWFLSNTGPDPLEYNKATNLAFNVGSLLARQQNAI